MGLGEIGENSYKKDIIWFSVPRTGTDSTVWLIFLVFILKGFAFFSCRSKVPCLFLRFHFSLVWTRPSFSGNLIGARFLFAYFLPALTSCPVACSCTSFSTVINIFDDSPQESACLATSSWFSFSSTAFTPQYPLSRSWAFTIRLRVGSASRDRLQTRIRWGSWFIQRGH